MQAIIPQALSVLNDSVPENEAPPWDAATTYTAGDKVIDDHLTQGGTFRWVFVALEATQGVRPFGNSDIAGAPWRAVNVTNRDACIDIYRHTQTIAPEGATELTIAVPFTRPASAVGLLNMAAASLTVTLTDSGGNEAWSSGKVNLLSDSTDWWRYYFDIFQFTEDLSFTGIPPVSGELTVTLYGGRPAIGSIIVGELVDLGRTEYGATTGFIDYSANSTDEYGNEVFIKRRNAKRGEFTCFSPPSAMAYIQRVTARLSGRPTLWIGDDGTGFENMLIHGFVREFSVRLDAWSRTTATFELRGIV